MSITRITFIFFFWLTHEVRTIYYQVGKRLQTPNPRPWLAPVTRLNTEEDLNLQTPNPRPWLTPVTRLNTEEDLNLQTPNPRPWLAPVTRLNRGRS
ncbi:hypothetical protein RRG08_011101 [Elysia crispata]|uniref:Secreted protein n=1 Tax=Elysia crispata TaxID=231223 RepID=A0AAE1A3J1_9GAST|nr:hypothetical protein RRG08_011101 [Elysia crispata]